jgi:hypothetical protein
MLIPSSIFVAILVSFHFLSVTACPYPLSLDPLSLDSLSLDSLSLDSLSLDSLSLDSLSAKAL